jgi:hypothetical protein
MSSGGGAQKNWDRVYGKEGARDLRRRLPILRRQYPELVSRLLRSADRRGA